MNPLVANVIGFLCASGVSYFGHKNYTFEARDHAHSTALLRFFGVAIMGFAINESLYAVLLQNTALHYMVSLTIAKIVAAVGTYLLLNYWAFYRKDAGGNAPAIICADDFGMTAGISEGILALCAQGKLNAVSVMTEAPLLPTYSAEFLKHAEDIQIGLHFNLTESFAGEAFSRNYLMTRLQLPAAEQEKVLHSLRRQLSRFEEIFGRAPDFVDGHEHVHVMAAVRKIFLRELADRYGDADKKPWIRQLSNAVAETDAPLKACVLNVLNIGFRADCKKHGFETNDGFRGIYSFKSRAPFGALLKKWLRGTGENVLIMLHPSSKIEAGDAISSARFAEFQTLISSPESLK